MKDRRSHRFSARDHQIVRLAIRYRLLTNDVVHAQFFGANQPHAATKVTQRLSEDGWIKKYPLIYPTYYYVPGQKAARLMGIPYSRTLPLGPQALPTEYAVLQYATGTNGVHRITSAELLNRYPWYSTEFCAATHCLRQLDKPHTLELVRVDLGGPADHVARKCYASIAERLQLQEMEEQVSSSLFQVVVLTASTDKAGAIQRALENHLWPSGLRFHFGIVPLLLSLLPNYPET